MISNEEHQILTKTLKEKELSSRELEARFSETLSK